jgi:hypothetical protein
LPRFSLSQPWLRVNRQFEVRARTSNGRQVPKTGGWTEYKAVKLKAGQNQLEIRNEGRGGANLDDLDVTPAR